MEGAAGDEQDVVGLDHAVLGRHRGALDQRQQVPLHALARHLGAMRFRARGDLVDLVEEHDAVLLDVLQRVGFHFLVVDQARGLFIGQRLQRVGDFHPALPLLAAADVLEHALDLLGQVFHPRRGEDLHARLRGGNLDFDFLVVEIALAQLLAELLPGAARPKPVLARRLAGADSCRRQQHVQHAVLGGIHGAVADDAHGFLAGVLDRRLGQVANDGVHVAADVADFGELGRLDLDEGRMGEPRQAPRDFGLADAGRADHQDVLRRDFGAQRLGDLDAAPAVAQGDRHGALGARLADDMLVELGNDFRRSHGGHSGPFTTTARETRLVENFDQVVLVGVDAKVAGDLQRLLDDFGRRQVGVLQQRARR